MNKSHKINPEAEILQQLDGHWQQLLMVVLINIAPDGVTITDEDVMKAANAFPTSGGPVIMTHGHKDSIELKVISGAEARHLAAMVEMTEPALNAGKGH
jgi:hypothetical protein